MKTSSTVFSKSINGTLASLNMFLCGRCGIPDLLSPVIPGSPATLHSATLLVSEHVFSFQLFLKLLILLNPIYQSVYSLILFFMPHLSNFAQGHTSLFSYVLLFTEFYILDFTLRFMIHFELIFVIWCKVKKQVVYSFFSFA